MSTLYAINTPPGFAAGNDLHTTDGVATLWDTARLLDMASLAPRDLFQGHSDHRHEFINENPLTSWWSGGYRYWPGLTYLSVTIDHAELGVAVTPRLRVYVNTVLRIDASLLVGMNTYTVTGMGAWGLAAGDACEVRAEIVDTGRLPGPDLPPGSTWGRYYYVDGYVGPASALVADPYPGVPTFTNSPDEARMLQLGNAGLWLTRRMAAVPAPLFQRVWGSPELPWWVREPTEPVRHLWSGGLVRGVYDRITSRIEWLTGSSPNQRVRMLINGAEVATTPNISVARYGFHVFDVNISAYSATAPMRVELELVISAGEDAGGYPTRFTVLYVEARRSSPPFQAMSNRPVAWESSTWAVRRTRLQAIATVLTTVKGRIDAEPDRWDRIRLFRSSYAYGLGEAEYLKNRYWTVRRQRTGARLIVRGSNIKLGWGPLSFKLQNDKEPHGEYEVGWGFEETLVGGNDVETREIALDTLEGLFPGMQYVVYGGDVRYAAEEPR
jgi:hypothetical protein